MGTKTDTKMLLWYSNLRTVSPLLRQLITTDDQILYSVIIWVKYSQTQGAWGSPECPCANGNQTVDHLIYDCIKLNNEREKLIAYISKEDNWPIRKSELVKKYLKQLIYFTNSTDYEKL